MEAVTADDEKNFRSFLSDVCGRGDVDKLTSSSPMPHLIYFGRLWRFSADELSLPSVCAAVTIFLLVSGFIVE
jgi:hypothetical protein